MNNHLKQILKGILILFWMIVFWIFASISTLIFPALNEDYHTQIFYIQIILSFYLFLILILFFFRKNEIKSLSNIVLLFAPFVVSFLLMQFAQVNVPRLLDIGVLIIGSMLIYYLVNIKNDRKTQNIFLLTFFIVIGLIYPIAYDNVWYYIHKSDIKESRNLGDFNIKITNINGNSFNMIDFKGQTVCVDMWASSCGNCIASMPDFEKLNRRFKNNKEYKIISLYCPIKKDQTFEWFKKYIENKFDYDIDYYYVDYESFNKLNIRQFPEFLIINKKSNLLYRGQISYLPYISDNIFNKLKTINEDF